jgi:transcriptional regulator GlxA family with amidase domain
MVANDPFAGSAVSTVRPIAVDILALQSTAASSLYGFCDILGSVGIVWESVVAATQPAPRFAVRVVSVTGEPFRCAGGAGVTPAASLREASGADIALVPAFHASPSSRTDVVTAEVRDWLAGMQSAGATVVSACTGAIVLAESGLLDGREATTHWAYRNLFRRLYPEVRLQLEKNLCTSGRNDDIVTSGGSMAWQELALYLIARHCGRQCALQTAKFWLLPNAGELQSPYISMPNTALHEDADVHRSQSWLDHHFAAHNPVDGMLEHSRLPRTTFSRRFRRATGYTPMEYVHAIRVERAKLLLEQTANSVEQIGGQVGYEDIASFRRLFKRKTSLTPTEYRRSFGDSRFARIAPLP